MSMNFLKKIFYPPSYLSLPVAGIEISNGSIKYIELIDKKGSLRVSKFGEISLPADVVKNGYILKKEALVKALIEVKKKISADFIKVSIAEEKTFIFDTQIPKEAENNIREVLEFKIEENVPLKLDSAYFEYEQVSNDDVSNSIVLTVSVIPKKVISEYTEVFDGANMYPVSYEIESKMIAKSVIPKDSKKNSIIVNIKDDSTVLIAVVDGVVRASSSISVGESNIVQSLLKTGLFPDELSGGKFFDKDFSFETVYTNESYASLVNVFSILKDEIEKFNEYTNNRFLNVEGLYNKNIDNIILCGRSSILPGLAKHINQRINTEIVFANVWSNVLDIKESLPQIGFNESLNFAAAVGLSIPE